MIKISKSKQLSLFQQEMVEEHAAWQWYIENARPNGLKFGYAIDTFVHDKLWIIENMFPEFKERYEIYVALK